MKNQENIKKTKIQELVLNTHYEVIHSRLSNRYKEECLKLIDETNVLIQKNLSITDEDLKRIAISLNSIEMIIKYKD